MIRRSTLLIASAVATLAGAAVLAAVSTQGPTEVRAAAPDVSTDPTSFVKRQRIVERTQRLVRMNTEYDWPDVHNHAQTAAYLEQELKAIGLSVDVVRANPDYPVVIGRLKGAGGKPTLGFATHYNTVLIGNRSKWSFDPLSGDYKDGRIYGRGSSNSKGAVAADLETAHAIKDSGLKLSGDLVLVLMPGEGATEFAMPWIVKNRPDLIKADWYMGGGGGGNFTRMHAGHQWIKVVVKGTMAHPPCNPPTCVNAATKLLSVLPAIVKVEDWMTWKSEAPFENLKPTADVGKVVAGYSVNIIPDRAEADVDIRTVPTQTHEQIRAELDALVAKLKQADPQLDVEIQWIWWSMVPYSAWFKVKDDDPIVRAIQEIAPKYTGRAPQWSKGVGGGAGRPDLWESGANVIFFGIGGGGGHGAHGLDEWVSVDPLVANAKFQTELVSRLLK